MKGRTYAFLALLVMASVAAAWAVNRFAGSVDFRLVFTLKKVPPSVIDAAFGGRGQVADLIDEEWSASGVADDKVKATQHFRLARAYEDGSWEFDFERGGEEVAKLTARLELKDGQWVKVSELASEKPG